MVNGQRVKDHGMVGRDAGGVDRANAIGQHADSVAIEAAQHRARGPGRERGGRNAGQAGQRFAQLAAQTDVELVALDRAGAVEQVEVDRWMANHNDALFLGMGLAVRIGWLVFIGQRRGGEQGNGEGGEAEAVFAHGGPITRNVILYQVDPAQSVEPSIPFVGGSARRKAQPGVRLQVVDQAGEMITSDYALELKAGAALYRPDHVGFDPTDYWQADDHPLAAYERDCARCHEAMGGDIDDMQLHLAQTPVFTNQLVVDGMPRCLA